jgi:hypothetical protein
MEISINPITITIPTVKLTVDYKLNGICVVLWRLFDADGNQYKNGDLFLSVEEIAGWGTDDEYIINLALTKLGYTRA